MARWLALLLATVLLCGAAHAQALDLTLPPPEASSGAHLELADPACQKKQSAQHLLTSGLIAGIAGIALSGVGGLFLALAALNDHPSERPPLVREGAALIGVGAGAVLVGIPLVVIGGVRKHRAEKRLVSMSLSGLQGQF